MAADAPPLMLVSRSHLRSLNRWMHNVDTLVTGRDRCTLQMHSADATRHGLAVGDTVALSSTAGEIHVPLEIDDDIRPGVVSMPHGCGPSDPHSRLTVATSQDRKSVVKGKRVSVRVDLGVRRILTKNIKCVHVLMTSNYYAHTTQL